MNAGDQLYAAMTYKESSRSYDMYFSSPEGDITYNFKLDDRQTAAETKAYVVLEHQPYSCRELPRSDGIRFTDMHLEVSGTATYK